MGRTSACVADSQAAHWLLHPPPPHPACPHPDPAELDLQRSDERQVRHRAGYLARLGDLQGEAGGWQGSGAPQGRVSCLPQ